MKCKNKWNIYKPPHGWTWKTSLLLEGPSSPGWHFSSYNSGRPWSTGSRNLGTFRSKGLPSSWSHLLKTSEKKKKRKHLKIWWTPFSRFALSFGWFLLRSYSWTSTTFFFFLISAIKKKNLGSSLVIQWLWLCTSNTWNSGSIPGHGTRIPHNHMRNPKTKARSCLIKLK